MVRPMRPPGLSATPGRAGITRSVRPPVSPFPEGSSPSGSRSPVTARSTPLCSPRTVKTVANERGSRWTARAFLAASTGSLASRPMTQHTRSAC
jgi:hypothetical protein